MLWLVYAAGGTGPDDLLEDRDGIEIADGLFLIRSEKTRSRLYHALKRSAGPDTLLVAPLREAPKFKGMRAGALKWLRSKIRD